MSEDCLVLNVWTPSLDDARRPTMVWFHGGGAHGAGSAPAFDGSAFARDDVVLVTVNYRLGAFGFLYLDELFDDASTTGNLGILDQVAALRWVQENIAGFGGDPDNVTIFGESYGGMCVASLLTTDEARGFFRRAIVQSGPVQLVRSAASARAASTRALDLLGVDAGDWDAILDVPSERLAELGVRGQEVSEESTGSLAFWPVVDGVTRTDRPCQVLSQGSAGGVDLLIGWCAEECKTFYAVPEMAERLSIDVGKLVAPTGVDAAAVSELYRMSGRGETDRDLVIAMQSDAMFIGSAIRFADAGLAHHDRVFVWRLSWPSPALGGAFGAGHALDVPIVFETPSVMLGDAVPPSLGEMHASWVRFARTGDPNGGDLPSWPVYDVTRRPVMDFDAQNTVVDDPNPGERALWQGVDDSLGVSQG